MQIIPLNKVPSQDLNINLDGAYWRLNFYLSMSFVCVDFQRDGNILITGVRCFYDQPLLPYSYLYAPKFGNFLFDNEVNWEDFNDTCSLYYLNADEFKRYNELIKIGYEYSAIRTLIKLEYDFSNKQTPILTQSDIKHIKVDSLSLSSSSKVNNVSIRPVNQTIFIHNLFEIICECKNWDMVIWEFRNKNSNNSWKKLRVENYYNNDTVSFRKCNSSLEDSGFYRAIFLKNNIIVAISKIAEIKVI